ncbi:MAG TPA: YhdH/YhfP family quinone oxidoreductase [Polyangiaceae bacterium]|nr:YhdH/YhfP family quinone oxidoreductase [Polyangiaceae bacterium]
MIPATIRAFRIEAPDQPGHRVELAAEQLGKGPIVVRVAYSSVNYKDALAGTGRGKILRRFPLVGGIDLSGHVVESHDPRFREGDAVLATGTGLSETRDGGYAEYARLEPDNLVPLPAGLDLREAMILGTAGFTAGLALLRLEANGQRPSLGPLLVTGASGGVGSLAVAVFSRAGYEVHAVSGKPEQAAFLRQLGATQVMGRDLLDSVRPLESAIFGGGLDTVGGSLLPALLARTVPYGSVASAGLVAGADLATSVMPFIIRGVSLLGVASAGCPRELRERVWARLATDWKPSLEQVVDRSVGLDELPEAFERLLAGRAVGRTLVVV